MVPWPLFCRSTSRYLHTAQYLYYCTITTLKIAGSQRILLCIQLPGHTRISDNVQYAVAAAEPMRLVRLLMSTLRFVHALCTLCCCCQAASPQFPAFAGIVLTVVLVTCSPLAYPKLLPGSLGLTTYQGLSLPNSSPHVWHGLIGDSEGSNVRDCYWQQ